VNQKIEALAERAVEQLNYPDLIIDDEVMFGCGFRCLEIYKGNTGSDIKTLAMLEDEDGNQFVSWLQHGHWTEPVRFAPMWKVAYFDIQNGDEGDLRGPDGVLLYFSEGSARAKAQKMTDGSIRCWEVGL